jgi:hypothetical protein
MVDINAVIVNPEYKILAHVETYAESEQNFLSYMDIDNPRWYPIPGGWLIVNAYDKNQQEILKLTKPYGFEFMNVHYHSNAIFLRGTKQNELQRYITIKEQLEEDFMTNEIESNMNFFDMIMNEITFFTLGYSPEHDESL